MHDGTYIIGREPVRGQRPRRLLAIEDGGVSERHAELTILLGEYHLRDLGSTNGTWRERGNRLEALEEGVIDPEEAIVFGRTPRRIADLVEAATGERPARPAAPGNGRNQDGGDPIPTFRAAWQHLRGDGDPIPSFRAAWRTCTRPVQGDHDEPMSPGVPKP